MNQPIRTIDEIRTTAAKEGITASDLSRASSPRIPRSTVWRILTGKREGHSKTQEGLSQALNRLLENK